MRRILCAVAGAALLVGTVALPAAAQTDAPVLVSEPSAEELCAALEDLGDAVDPAAVEELLAETAGDLGDIEPEPVKGAAYDDLAAALRSVLDTSDEASVVSVASAGRVLAVSVLPDVSTCEGLGDVAGGSDLPAGNYRIELAVEDVCAVAEDLDAEVDEDAVGDLADAGAGLDALVPQPAEDPERFDEVRATFDAVRAEVAGAGEVAAVHDGAALVVTTAPAPEDCDVPVEVAAGFGGADGGPPAWALLSLTAGLLCIAAAASWRPAAARQRSSSRD